MIVLWAPIALNIASNDTESIAELTLFSAIGIVIGSLVAAKLIPLEKLAHTRYAAMLMGVAILFVAMATDGLTARIALLFVGIAGGIFVVPINATIQEIGHKTVGAGGAVSVQNFLHNVGMLFLTLLYSAVAAFITPSNAILILGMLVIVAVVAVSRNLENGARNAG
jgi:LPLT family lysophospholipid transporter-like MFS transporter